LDCHDDRVDFRGLTAEVDGSGYSVEVVAHLSEIPAGGEHLGDQSPMAGDPTGRRGHPVH
jgi:hypothetical protein